jgi:hypothetical protein
MIEIVLHNGMVARVDDEDAHLAQKAWRASGPRAGVWYAVRQEGPRGGVITFYLHREVCGLAKGDGLQVDHEDGDGLNCCRGNLRIAPQKINARNKKLATNNTSGFTGVAYHSRWNHWRAHIVIDQKQIHLGTFTTKEDAARARALAEVERIGVHPQRALELSRAIGDVV